MTFWYVMAGAFWVISLFSVAVAVWMNRDARRTFPDLPWVDIVDGLVILPLFLLLVAVVSAVAGFACL